MGEGGEVESCHLGSSQLSSSCPPPALLSHSAVFFSILPPGVLFLALFDNFFSRLFFTLPLYLSSSLSSSLTVSLKMCSCTFQCIKVLHGLGFLCINALIVHDCFYLSAITNLCWVNILCRAHTDSRRHLRSELITKNRTSHKLSHFKSCSHNKQYCVSVFILTRQHGCYYSP